MFLLYVTVLLPAGVVKDDDILKAISLDVFSRQLPAEIGQENRPRKKNVDAEASERPKRCCSDSVIDAVECWVPC